MCPDVLMALPSSRGPANSENTPPPPCVSRSLKGRSHQTRPTVPWEKVHLQWSREMTRVAFSSHPPATTPRRKYSSTLFPPPSLACPPHDPDRLRREPSCLPSASTSCLAPRQPQPHIWRRFPLRPISCGPSIAPFMSRVSIALPNSTCTSHNVCVYASELTRGISFPQIPSGFLKNLHVSEDTPAKKKNVCIKIYFTSFLVQRDQRYIFDLERPGSGAILS